ncbi:MAG: type II secretion system protein [Desulfobacteraceae bacterium]|nr:type II secretion system protein [Desulfobacteraceae bacterium]MBC2754925.1 type II secretion system protein [Desulfobacteraceae bacterium]
MKFRSDAGSTLIELLISITIVGVILVVIMGAFRIGIRAWEVGERDVESFQRQQIVLSILKRQLSSICWRPISIEGEESFVFSGDEGLIDFISSVSIVPGNDIGNVRVTYRVGSNDKNDLYYLEIAERNFLTGGADETIDTLDDDMIHKLIANVYDIRFEYLKKMAPGEERQWQPEWNQEVDTGLPAAVKCILQMDEKKPPVAVIARVLSQEDIS